MCQAFILVHFNDKCVMLIKLIKNQILHKRNEKGLFHKNISSDTKTTIFLNRNALNF